MDYAGFFGRHLKGVKWRSGGEGSAKCPFHDDRRASFSVNRESGLWWCHAEHLGGAARDFAARLGVEAPAANSKSADAVYDYRDEKGALLSQVVRFAGKEFRQRRPDGTGGWIWKLGDVRRVPYRLPEMLKARSNVFVVEGEKDVESLRAQGLIATCNPGGAGKWREEYGEFLRDRVCILVADNDEPGRKHVEDVARKLTPYTEHVINLGALPGSPEHGDVSDWLAAGNTLSDLIALVSQAEKADSTAAPRGAGVAGDGAAPELPVIDCENRRLRDLVSDALAALEASNRRAITVFQRSGAVVRIKREDGLARIEVLDADSLGLMLDRAANWIKDKGTYVRATEPPERVVRSLLKLASYDFPSLRGIAHAPFFNAAGRLVSSRGYDGASEVVLDPVGLSALEKVPERPTADDVRLALEYLKGELLGDFPFGAPADRANAIGLLVTPFVRAMIDGPVPLHVIDSPQVGTGKSLLASIAHIVATGRVAPTGVERFEQAEAHKAITALLLEAPPFILLDNVDRRVISGAFAAVLTAEQWTDRVLGQSKMVTVENRAIWVATGNNLTLSSELRRRAVEVRLDAKMERPEERTSFRHPDLKAWTRDNRPKLVYACLLLIENWIALGRPTAQIRSLASFANWSNIVGGVLAAAQVEGFLANAESFRERADPDAQNWRRFVEEWAAAHGSNSVTVELLAPIAQGLMPELLGSGNEISQHSRLAKALRRRFEQVIADWRIESAECRDAGGRARNGYRLARAGAGRG